MRDDRLVYERLERKFASQKRKIVIIGGLTGVWDDRDRRRKKYWSIKMVV